MGLKAIWDTAWGCIFWVLSLIIKIVLYLFISLFSLIILGGCAFAIIILILYALDLLPMNEHR